MLLDKKLLMFFSVIATASRASAAPHAWPQGQRRCTGTDALLAIRSATGLPGGFNVPLSGQLTPTLVNEAAVEVNILYTVGADCRFFNGNGELVAQLISGQTEVTIGPPQVLSNAVCDPCIERPIG